MSKKSLAFLSIAVVVLSLVLVSIGGIHAASDTMIVLNPKVSGGTPTESFSVNVTIADVTNVYAWQVNLTFTPSILEGVSVAEGPFLKQFRGTLMATPNINNTGGYVFAGCAFLSWEDTGASGSGVLATINFRVKAAGTSPLHFSLTETGLRTYDGNLPVPMAYQAVDGVFGYPRDLAVTGLVASASSVPAGESVSLTATVLNKGVVNEIFDVTVYRDSTAIDVKRNVALDSGASAPIAFTWGTTGVPAGTYTLKAGASVVAGENDTANNVFSDGTITIELVHDVAITGLTVSPTSVTSGEQVSINVTAFNKGSGTESFGVTVSCGSTEVGTKQITDLAPGTCQTLIFVWDTKDIAAGGYMLTATAATISGEVSTTDNAFSNVSLQITSPPFTLPMEWILIIAVVIIVLVVGVFLLMRRRSKKT